MQVILTRGIQASGKTTWALEYLRTHPNTKRFNLDLYREMVDGGVWSMKNEKFIRQIREFSIETALVSGYDVIIDDTNLNDLHWESICEIAKRVGNVSVEEKTFIVDLDEAIRRDSLREKSVGEEVIRNTYKKFRDRPDRRVYFPPLDIQKYLGKVENPCILVDLDGTLAWANGRDWYDEEKCDSDLMNEKLLTILQGISGFGMGQHIPIFITSGRTEKVAVKIKDWLREHGLLVYRMYLRKEGDTRKDAVIKKEFYDHIILTHNVLCVFDDRQSVVNMWRSLGLMVFQTNFRIF